MELKIRCIDLHLQPCRTRLPFRFGMTTLRAAPYATLRVEIESGGDRAYGYASDLLVPKWFEKDPNKSTDQDIANLQASITRARDAYLAADQPQSPFALWWDVYRKLVGGEADGLVSGFGIALIERALIDASCRVLGKSFADAMRDDSLGFSPAKVHSALDGWRLADSLPEQPLAEIAVRHTIGLADDLRANERSDRIKDGLPETLEEDIRAYGLRYFKLKLGGDPTNDVARLSEVAAVLDDCAGDQAALTIDGNEQFKDMHAVLATLEAATKDRRVDKLLGRLLHIEQPIARQHSFSREALVGITELDALAPVIIDEADATTDSFPHALDCGYRGVSVKNCKGVFRALLNTGLCHRNDSAFQCSEDLTNLPILALQQDLATSALLGLPHTERNGHHYFRGLDHLPKPAAAAAAAAHPDLYRETKWGTELRIENGTLEISSLQQPGYGYGVDLDDLFEATQ